MKIKRYIKKNFGKIILFGLATLIGLAVDLNIWFMPALSYAEINLEYFREQREFRKSAAQLQIIDLAKQGVIREVSAYNSVLEQTDSTPCIATDGSDICQRYQQGECIVGSNTFKRAAKIYIDKIGECTVADRMVERFQNRLDVFMDKDIRAKKFGVQDLFTYVID